MNEIPETTRRRIRELLPNIRNKRARIVIEHILAHGHITTEDLEHYGYKHPPRAARDVREAGIPLVTFRVKSADGSRSIAAYTFGDLSELQPARLQGRRTFPRKLKRQLYAAQNGRCAICGARFEMRYLQVDHRVPYAIAGETAADDPARFMLLCGACNRAKSWSCEHCPNWEEKRPEPCAACYWGAPENYAHIALQPVRRVDVQFSGAEEVALYEDLAARARAERIALAELIKQLLRGMWKRKD